MKLNVVLLTIVCSHTPTVLLKLLLVPAAEATVTLMVGQNSCACSLVRQITGCTGDDGARRVQGGRATGGGRGGAKPHGH
jgi:hypothetical protein